MELQTRDNVLPSSLDRIKEALFYAEKLEDLYHNANEFRWILGSYLKCIKEIPQIIQMEMQNQVGFSDWFSTKRNQLRVDPLLSYLFKQRNIVVHKEMLQPASSAFVGTTELRGLKLGFRFPIDPFEDSSVAMIKYLQIAAIHGDISMVLVDDDDSIPCIWRKWCLNEFETELGELSYQALEILINLFEDVMEWSGQVRREVTIERKPAQMYRACLFNREELKVRFQEICDSLEVEPVDFWGSTRSSTQ